MEVEGWTPSPEGEEYDGGGWLAGEIGKIVLVPENPPAWFAYAGIAIMIIAGVFIVVASRRLWRR